MTESPEKALSNSSDGVDHLEHASRTHGNDVDDLNTLGYKPELQRNRSMFTLLFQSLAIAAVSLLQLWNLATYCQIADRYRFPMALVHRSSMQSMAVVSQLAQCR